MFDALFAVFLALLIIDSAHTQVIAPDCSDDSYAWSYNSLGQNPCLIVAYLASVCNNGAFTIFPLLPLYSYTGPSGQDNGNACKCNTVAYNLISACDVCQGEEWISYSSWSFNCTSVAAPGTFPKAIPAATRVPFWAYIVPPQTGSDYWNESLAQSVGNKHSPEVTGSASNVPSSTSNHYTITPETSSPASSSSPSKSNSNAGAIAGGVVGGIIGVALIAGLVAWFTIRRRQRRAPSADYISGQGSDVMLLYPMNIATPRLYDPSDPSTYPTRLTSPMTHLSNSSTRHLGSSSDLRHSRTAYEPLPEI